MLVGEDGLSHKKVGGAIALSGGQPSASSSVEPLSQWLPDDAQRRRLTAVWFFFLPVAVASGSDRLGTIDLPCQRRIFRN
jgi:hypothetical protein